MLVECVLNVSEGRDLAVLGALSDAAGELLLDRHEDPHHHRSVFTLAGRADDVEDAARSLARIAVASVDLGAHDGVHPRLGALDVAPFVPYALGAAPPSDLAEVVVLRDAFARWLARELRVPAFLYGPLGGSQARTLPEVRRGAFARFAPDFGPRAPHATAGATAVGARSVLVAYNVWVESVSEGHRAVEIARSVASRVRGPQVRTLGLQVGDRAQVSCNLVAPALVGPAEVYDAVAAEVDEAGGHVTGAELVGLVPAVVLGGIPTLRWPELGLAESATVEARLAERGRA